LETELRAGVARVTITPPIGVPMAGYAGRGPSDELHDSLTATALVLSDGQAEAAVVGLDLLYLSSDVVADVRAKVAAASGVPAERVCLACSHTHYGPNTARREPGDPGGQPDAAEAALGAYLAELPYLVAGAVRMAKGRLAPVRVGWGAGHAEVGVNRRERRPDGTIWLGVNPDGPIDPEVALVRLDGADGKPIASLLGYATHGTTLASTCTAISADFPAVAREIVERLVGGTALYLQGACGDINPRLRGQDWDYVRRSGTVLGCEAARVLVNVETHSASGPLRVASRKVGLPALVPESLEAGRSQVAQLEAEVERLRSQESGAGSVWWAEHRLEAARRRVASLESGVPLPDVEAELMALAFGDVALVTAPGEVFNEIGRSIKARSPFARTLFVGYSNGSIGYVPTRPAFAEGGYEVTHAARVGPAAGEVLEREAIALLESLR
jgi:hypothetical protein